MGWPCGRLKGYASAPRACSTRNVWAGFMIVGFARHGRNALQLAWSEAILYACYVPALSLPAALQPYPYGVSGGIEGQMRRTAPPLTLNPAR